MAQLVISMILALGGTSFDGANRAADRIEAAQPGVVCAVTTLPNGNHGLQCVDTYSELLGVSR